MKPTLILLLAIGLLATSLFAFDPSIFFPDSRNESHRDTPVAHQNEELGMSNTLILDIGVMVSDLTPETGVAFTYTISYATQSLVEDADNPVIEVPLPNGIQVVSFVGNAEVGSTEIVNVMGTPTFRINMKNPLEAGAAGILLLELVIPPGQVCDGTIIPAAVTFSADDADNSPVSDQTDITVSAPNEEWNVNVNAVTVGVPGSTSLFQIGISPSAVTGFIALDNATLTAEIPANTNVVNCSGCMQSGTTLTWDVSNASGATSFPLVLEFPSPPYDFSDNFSIAATLDGTTISDCPVDVDDTDTYNGTLPSPNPLIQCGVGLSTFEIGDQGGYVANADVTGNVEVDDFTATITIPQQIQITGIRPSIYLFEGLPVMVTYETNLGGPFPLGSFNTTLDGSAGDFAPPTLGAGEFLTTLVYEFGTVPPGFGPVDGIVLDYEVLATDQLGNPVIGANPRITDPLYVSCPNAVYTCISPEVEVSANYEGEPLPNDLCDESAAVTRIPPVGPGSPNKSASGNIFFVGDEVTYTLSFNVCGPDPLVNGLVTDELPAGVNLVPGSVAYSSNITDIGTPALNQTGNTLAWDFSGIDLPGSTDVEEDCGATYTIEYTVEVTEVANGPGSSTLNNTFTIDGDDVDIAPEAELPGDEDNITIPPIGPTNLSKTSLNGSAGNPEDTITFRLRFRNQGPFDVNNVVIVDQLPMGLDFVPGTIQYNGGLTPADNDGMVYNSGNRTLTFEWASLSGSAPGERYSEFYEITYDVAIPRGFPPGPLQNCFSVAGTGDYIRQDLPLEDCETFTVNALVQTSSRKGVRGDCDADFVFFDPNGPNPTLDNLNGIGRTFQGGAADWKLIIENTGNVEVKDITVIDIMPFIGDEAISFPADRESEWRTNFVEVVSMPANATVEYSIEPNLCRADFSPAYEPAGCTGPFWSTTPPVDVTETQALKFFLPTPLGPGEQTEIVFSTQAPVDAPEDAIAWNSLAYQGRRTDTPGEEYFLVAEPNKVGIAIKADTVSVGNYVWSDDNMDGIQNEPAELGINGVSVDLYRLVGMKDATPGAGDDIFVGNRLTGDNHFGNPGYYLFANLPEGQYYAVFDENSFPPGQVPSADMPTLLNAGGDDVVDSDADQTTMFMTDLTPALTEAGQAKDTTLDLGLIATDCDLFPTVMVMCDDRGTAQVNDDRYTWTLQVNREINSALDNNGTFTLQVMNADGLEIDVVPNLAYGVEHPVGDEFGPFDISDGDLMFEVKDDTDLSCEAFGTVEAPATLNITGLDATECMDDGMGNLIYNLTGTVEIGGAPTGTGARLEVFFMDSGNTESQIFDPIAEDGTYDFSFNGLICDGESFDVEARFIDGMGNMIDGTCTGERRLHEPCYLEITDIQIEDNCRADGTYTVNVIGTYFNGTGDMEISIAGNSAFSPATQTLNLANRADGVEETLASFTKTCDGQLHEVTAAFNGSCMDTENFEGPRDRDFGDVPDTYGTTLDQNGAFHIIHDDLFLGDCVDSELDGSPEAQAGVDGTPSAGAGTGGDDGSGVETEMGEASFSACPGDDENGVRFITPMVPGNEACVEVTTTNNTGSLAALQMWVDFDGNGSFSSGEEVAFTEPIVGTGTNTTDYCFDVPASATFPNLETFVRVRLSSAGGLNATGPANDGEVEDYYLAFAKIGDLVWEDLDYDGIQDAGEPGIAGAEVSISGIDLNGGAFTAGTTTDGTGMYMFSGLFPGDYMLTFTTPDELAPSPQGEGNDGMVDSDADPGTGNTITYTLSAGDNNPDVDAGFFVPAIEVMAEEICVDNAPYVNYSITPIGFTPSNGATITWVDPDADTVVTVLTNQPLSGTLLWPGAVVDNGVAVDWPGWVLVEGVWERVEDGLRPELRLQFDVNPSDTTIVMYPPGTPQCSGNPTLGELGDYVWEDLNANGIQDPGEPPVENVTVNLLTENGDFIESTMTDADGLYLFDSLGPANFIVEFITPGGFEITPADNAGMDDTVDSDAGDDGQTGVITLGSGETNYTIDAGIYQPASLGSTVWEDSNGNGQQDNDEDGVPGVTVTLFTCVNGMPDAPVPGAEVMTDANGDYEFTGLVPGSYMVVFDYSGIFAAQDYIYTLANIEGNTVDALDSDVIDENGNVNCITLASGEDDPTIDAGIYPDEDGDLVPDDIDPSPEEADPTGYIYCESTGEIIPGGSISVDGPGPVDIVQDGSSGFYGFFAVSVSGTYTIQFTPPAGYAVSPDCMEEGGVFDAPVGVTTLGSGEDAGNPGFMEDAACGSTPFYYSIDLEPGVFVFNNNIPLSCASIGDLVWEDDNLDGVQDNDEAGVPDIQVALFECNNGVKGDQVDETQTDNNGNYIFTGLPAGVEYCVLFDLENSSNSDAESYQFTEQDQTDNGGNDTNDSDANPADGCTSGITLSEGEDYEDFDAGLFRLDYGDLPEDDGYVTADANNGPAHSVPTDVLLKLGSAVDAEPDGQPSANALGDGDDEDGVVLPLFITGEPVDVPVMLMNMTGEEAKLVFFIDWNGDGDFEENGEMYDLTVPNGDTEATFEDVTPPLTSVTGEQQVGVRFRISTDMDAVMSPTGIAPDGEVEDYLTPILGFDYGDLNDPSLGTSGDPSDPLTPANYKTLREDNGPRHRLSIDVDNNTLLKIGNAVDDEANGQPSIDAGATAGGDDNTATPDTDPDDEDGLDLNNLPLFILTQTTTLEIPVMNMTGSGATLALFLDFNKDGAFDPSTERFSVLVPNNATSASIDVPVPVTSVVGQDVGLRLRLANNPEDVATAVGEAQSGEVEDYMVQIVGFDYGDLPVSYGTQDPDAPKHIISEDLLLGQCVDVELDGQPETLAEGDDNGSGLVTFGTCNEADDDENGIDFITPLVPGTEACVSVTAVNNTGEDAVLQFWIDWDGNGSFGTGEEVSFSTGNTIPDGGLSGEILCFDVPEDATFEGGSAYSRARLSPEGGLEPDSQTGELPFGEIEDYKETLYLVGSYVWEDLDGDGLQGDFSTPCFNGLAMELEWAGVDGNLNTTNDNEVYTLNTASVSGINGQYVFEGLIPGTYTLRIAELPTGYGPTVIGAGNDEDLDSNDPANTSFTILEDGTLRTGEDGTGDDPGNINGYPDAQDNLSFDFGFRTEGYEVICNCDGSITLDWAPFSTGNNWTVDVEDENGNPVVDFVNMSSTQVTFVPGTLMNGVCYNFVITENLGNAEVEAISGLLHANCNPVPVLSLTGEGPSCPTATDGFLTITLEEQGCNATYDVYLIEAGVGETLVGSAVSLSQPILVEDLGEGTFRVRLELVDRGSCAYGDGCLPELYQEAVTLETTDSTPPSKTVTDQAGLEPPMTIVYESIPEGECGVQFNWFVELDDDCLSDGVSLEAQITSQTDNPSVSPGASVTVSDEEPLYVVAVHAGIGTNTLLLITSDEAGNRDTMSYEITVVDNRAPEIYGPGDMQVQIPACEDSVPVNWQVSAIDDCDLGVELEQISGPQPGDVLAPGVYTVIYEATDDYGNTSQYSFDITVTQAQSPAPIVDVSGNGQFVIEDCAEDGFIVFSGHIYDCELQPGDVLDGLISISGAPLQITSILVNEGYAYFEATGSLSAGSYLIEVSYEGVTVGHAVEVVQDPDTPAVMTMPGNLTYQVPNCEGEAPASFAVQLEDDCDEDFGSASFTVNGAPAPPFDVALSDPANGYFAWSLSLSAGVHTIVGTYTDGGGNATEATATITVNADEDNTAPIIVYPSQNITEVLDPCGPDEAEICFQATAIDDCEGDILPTVTVTGPGSTAIAVTADGTAYCFTAGPGQYTVSIGAVDAAGNSTDEAFGVSVTQDDAPEANLACNDDINVTLDGNCSRVITADMVLEGNFGCLQEDDFTITIVNDDNPANGNILDGHGQWIYEITGPDAAGFEPCWGYVTGEDKTAPVVDCPDDTDVATISEPVQKIQGALETTDAQLELADYSCFLDGAGPLAGGQYYDIIEFQVNVDDIYTIYLNTSWGDGFTALYQGSFDADNPCENILYAADDNIAGNVGPIGGLFDPQVRVTLPLRAYETYFVLVSSFGSDVTGSYEHTIFSDGNGLVGAWNFTQTTLPDWTTQFDTTFSALPSTTEQLSIPLFCDDFDQIYGGDAGSLAQETAFIQGTYQWVGAPSAADNCDDNVGITATDSFTASGDCGDVVITRTFTATDGQGLTDECQQEITIRKPTLDDVNFPSFTAVVECDEDYPALANGNPSPELTGYPFIFTAFGIFDIAPAYCNIGASYEDLPTVDECEGRFKFRREWAIFDWCDPGSSLLVNQLIKVGDYTAPEVSCPAGTPISYSTSPFSCGASFEVPMPSVSDNCSNVTVYTEIVTTTEEEVINQYGLPTGQFVTDTVVVRTIQPGANRFVSSIPFGGHFFRYVAEDDCGNETELYCPFSVIDEIEPVAVCDDQLNVSIGGGNIVPGQPALARVFASDVDEGSWDNCGDVSIAIFRNNFNPVTYTCGTQNSVTGDFVDFFCCDVGVTSDITLVVTDQYGNQNSCWLSVTPEDKINPFCDAPDNVVVDCDDLPYGFDASDAGQLEDLFGMATGADNCGVASVQQVASNANLECGYGSITRIFRVTDVNGLSSTNSCVQVITINEVHNYEIYFPEDAEANCGTPTPDTVEYNELGCGLLAVTSSDEQFSASGDECYKIFRTWKVINWCQYDGESDPYIVGRDEDCNGTPGDGDRIANNGKGFWLLARPNGKIYFDQDTDETPDNNVPGINFCGVSNDYYSFEYDETGYYQYTQIIKVYDDTAPEISFQAASPFCSLDNENCAAAVAYGFTITEDCTPDDLTLTVQLDAFNTGNTELLPGAISGSYPDYTISGTFPVGSHTFIVTAEDGCGNATQAQLPFTVVDCKAPAPICLNGIAIELMPVDENGDNLPDSGAGMAEIWASDFVNVASQAPDCSEPIKYSINRVGEPNDPDQTGLVLDCGDLGTLVIEIWAYDAAGNSDFCETYILVQDNMGVCGAAAPFAAGAVNTEDNEPVEDVQVSLSGQASDEMTTENDGAYVFTNLTAGLDYTITPQRDGDYLNGVSTFDLVLIGKHILGVEPLNSPYKRIAADANNSGSITTLDLIQLRKLILSISTELPNNTSWRFVEASYVFPNPENPWQEAFPEVFNINNLPAAGISGANFIAVKIGDVTGDVIANSFSPIDERGFDGSFQLETANEALKAGNEYRIPFTAPELAAIEGFQGTLEFDAQALELVEVLPGIATAGHFGLTQAQQGRIAMSWNWPSDPAVNGLAKASTGPLFTLLLRARTDIQLSEALRMSDAVTPREAYGNTGTFEDVALHFGEAAEASGFVLYQNQPNPFRNETVIGFELPEAMPATVTISNVAGRVVRTYKVDGAKGYNQITVKASDLPVKGMVSYTIETKDHRATKQMVIIE